VSVEALCPEGIKLLGLPRSGREEPLAVDAYGRVEDFRLIEVHFLKNIGGPYSEVGVVGLRPADYRACGIAHGTLDSARPDELRYLNDMVESVRGRIF
jgi:hypothetical protein